MATKEDDSEEAAALEDQKEMASREVQSNQDVISSTEVTTKEELDPFGLDALISCKPKKDEKAKENKGKEEEETMRFLRLQREAIISCLEIAAKRYKIPWFVLAFLCFKVIASYAVLVLMTMNILFAGVRLSLTYW